MTVEEIIKLFDLKPHPEGGFYRETYRSVESTALEQLPERYSTATGSPARDRAFTRESMEWQVPPEMEKKVQEHAAALSARQINQAGQSLNEPSHNQDGIWSPVDKSETHAEVPPANQTDRPLSTCIYYLLTADSFSAMHRLKGDEIYHFYLGDPVEMLNLYPSGRWKMVKLGHDIAGGALVQHMVPHGVWQGSRLIDGGKFALLGTTMAPGFSFLDFEPGSRKALLGEYSSCSGLIQKLTHDD